MQDIVTLVVQQDSPMLRSIPLASALHNALTRAHTRLHVYTHMSVCKPDASSLITYTLEIACYYGSSSKRVFLLGPSHYVAMESCAVSRVQKCETPLGYINVDTEGISISISISIDDHRMIERHRLTVRSTLQWSKS